MLSGYVASILAATSMFAGITPETISKLRLDVAVPWKMPPPIAPSLLLDGTARVKYCGCSSTVTLHVFFRLAHTRVSSRSEIARVHLEVLYSGSSWHTKPGARFGREHGLVVLAKVPGPFYLIT